MLLLLGLATAASAAVVLDRIAVTVENEVITEGELLDDIRLMAFLNGDRPDFGPQSRRQAAERLVDQYLIRREMKISRYQLDTSGAEKALSAFKRSRFQSDEQYRQALKSYGISEEELLDKLRWQTAALQFIDFRFGQGLPASPPPSRSGDHLEIEAPPENHEAPSAEPAVAGQGERGIPPAEEEVLDRWLKQARSTTRIQYNPEAFQ
jgi:hypothetical protein